MNTRLETSRATSDTSRNGAEAGMERSSLAGPDSKRPRLKSHQSSIKDAIAETLVDASSAEESLHGEAGQSSVSAQVTNSMQVCQVPGRCVFFTQHEINRTGFRDIRAVTVVGDELYALLDKQIHVLEFCRDGRLPYHRSISVPAANPLRNLVGCSHNQALYLSDCSSIYRVNLGKDSVICWEMKRSYEPRGLSVTVEHTLLVTVCIRGAESRVAEYSSEGLELREIRFDDSIKWAWQTVQLSSDLFVVSYLGIDSLCRVSTINSCGEILRSRDLENRILKDIQNMVVSIALDNESQVIFVAEKSSERVLMFDYDLGEVSVSFFNTTLSCICFYAAWNYLIVGYRNGNLLYLGEKRSAGQ